MGGGCGTTNTFFAKDVAPAVMKEYGGTGGCGCTRPVKLAQKPAPKLPKKFFGGATCTGQPTMLRALGIMAGGRSTRKRRGGGCPCALGRFRGGYKPTAKNLVALRKYKAGKSIGFTMRSSLKAKGLIPRANGTKRVSNKYRY